MVKESGKQENSASRQPVGVEQNVPDQTADGAGGDQSKRTNDRREDLSNYELNTKTVSTTSEGYRIEGVTIAVVLNRKRLIETLGESATPEAIQAKVKEIERLASTAAGFDGKRGDQISVEAVEFAEDPRANGGFDTASLMGPLIGLATGLIKGLTVLGLVLIVVLFGLRPITRMLVEQREAQGGALAAGADSVLASEDGEVPALDSPGSTAELLGVKPPPNLIEDITGDVMRLSQKRLEQMVALDEEQAGQYSQAMDAGARCMTGSSHRTLPDRPLRRRAHAPRRWSRARRHCPGWTAGRSDPTERRPHPSASSRGGLPPEGTRGDC